MILEYLAPNSTISVHTPACCHRLHGCRLNAACFVREMSPPAQQNKEHAFQSCSGGNEMKYLRLLTHAGKQDDSSAAHNCIKSTKIEIYTRQHQSRLQAAAQAELLLQAGGPRRSLAQALQALLLIGSFPSKTFPTAHAQLT